jgi:nitrite reductase/ring-hydroxylating ferredoxin subunit
VTHFRVADLAELPPGKGKVLSVGDREVHVFNVGGRFYATASREGRIGHSPVDVSHGGGSFEVYTEDSPAQVRADQETFTVHVDGESIWIELPEPR